MGLLKESMRTIASRAVVYTGVAALGRKFFPKNGALIFYGHRVAADDEGYLEGLRPEWLDEQLAYLTRHYEIITLSQLLECYELGRPVPARSAVLTFDDGFRDNLTHGWPVLKRFGVTATIFVVTGCAESGELPWPQRLGFLFQHTQRPSLAVSWDLPDRTVIELPLVTPAQRRAAHLMLKTHLQSQPRERREIWLKRLARDLDVDAPRDRMLSWTDLRELQAAGWEIGAHTFSHPWLAQIPLTEAREEMQRSLDDLRRHLGVKRPSFCFPAGSHTSALMALARDLGFRSAFQPNPPHRVNNLANAHPFALGRMGLPNAPAVNLEAELDGPFYTLRRGLHRLTGKGVKRAA
jgi:peptidoglycan/xylan/chitin deacetylase (PgdA/CDA1 family)